MRRSTKAPSDRGDVIEDLNRLMAEEAEACLRYFHMRFRLHGEDTAAEQFFDQAIKETFEHATAIGQQIRALGAVPSLRINLSLRGAPVRLETALAEALDVEQQALDAYKDFLPRVADDPELSAFIQRQIEIETEHVNEIRTFVQDKAAVKLVPQSKSGQS